MKIASDSTARLGAALLSLSLLGAIGCSHDGSRATARIIDTNGTEVGTATFRTIDEGVLVAVDAHALPPGEHAVHIHEHGECVTPSFESDRDAAKGSTSLLRDGGTALVIHLGLDDYRSEPAGNAGPRTACGVIEEAT